MKQKGGLPKPPLTKLTEKIFTQLVFYFCNKPSNVIAA